MWYSRRRRYRLVTMCEIRIRKGHYAKCQMQHVSLAMDTDRGLLASLVIEPSLLGFRTEPDVARGSVFA